MIRLISKYEFLKHFGDEDKLLRAKPLMVSKVTDHQVVDAEFSSEIFERMERVVEREDHLSNEALIEKDIVKNRLHPLEGKVVILRHYPGQGFVYGAYFKIRADYAQNAPSKN